MPSPFLVRLGSLASSQRLAVEDDLGRRTFAELYGRALLVQAALCDGMPSLEGRRIALLVAPGTTWVEWFLGILLAGGVALPLSPLYPPSDLAWFAEDAGADTVILSPEHAARAGELLRGRRVFRTDEMGASPLRPALASIEPEDTAMLLYTSGTTGKPKGAMLTHQNLAVQAELLREAWGFCETDTLLHALPLHHLHGLGISLLTSLLAGACTRMLPRFEARRVWEELASQRCTVLMAVPTMYQKLLSAFEAEDAGTRARWAAGAAGLRLSTSGSAALPVTLASRWEAITGAIPLERFGMTEIGVGMSNPLAPAARRRGTVGMPLPTVEFRIGDDGELWIRGPSVFKGYFGREEATLAAFSEGWFRTGDIAEQSLDGYVRLLGRTSVDILKSGGYKLSALEIEETLRENPAIAEVAVVGLPDEVWGDRVVAVVVAETGREVECSAEALRAWAKERMAPYKVPREVLVVTALPRNPMGKVMKLELVKAMLAAASGGGGRA